MSLFFIFERCFYWDLMVIVLTIICKDEIVWMRHQVEGVFGEAPHKRLHDLSKWN
jgi:hypothetical protein